MPHSCGTRNGLQVFEKEDGAVDGYCFSCNSYVPDPLGEGKTVNDIPKAKRIGKTKEEIKEEIGFISTLKALDLPDRRIRANCLEYYGIKVGLSPQDGKTVAFHYYPYTLDGELKAYKARLVDKKRMWSVGDQKEVDLFGWDQAVRSGAKRLIIVEGELDAAAAYGIIEKYTMDKFMAYKPAIVSLPHGAASAKRDISKLLTKIRRHFKEVYLCFDNDKAGKEAMHEVCAIFPEASTIELPEKDANECVLKGAGKAAFAAMTFKAEKPKTSKLVWGEDVHESAKKQAEWGLSWPWEAMTQYTRGIRFGETIYIAAGEKMGKSEVVNAIGAHLINEHNLKIMMAKPEEANAKTYKLMAGKICGKIFHDPKIEFDHEAYEEAGKMLRTNLCMLDLYQNITWAGLKDDIVLAASEGVKAVFIDPITNLTNGMASSEINTALQGVAQELATLAKDLDIVILIFCHLNKPAKGAKPWDRGGKITTDYFAGSSAMARSCHYAIGLEGNKDPELTPDERNMRKFVILADREYGESGSVDLYWDRNTQLFNEA